jgi:hypothetical protein
MSPKICEKCSKTSGLNIPWCPLCGSAMKDMPPLSGAEHKGCQNNKNRKSQNKKNKNDIMPGYSLVFKSTRPIGKTVTALLESFNISMIIKSDSSLGPCGKVLFPEIYVKNEDQQKCFQLFNEHGIS